MPFNATSPHELPPLPQKSKLATAAFIPHLLAARTSLGELNGLLLQHPNPMFLISTVVTREAVISSRIENINTTVANVLQSSLIQEKEQNPSDKEVLRYRSAIEWGRDNIDNFGISTRFILGLHKKLIPQSRGAYRQQQNSITDGDKIIYTPPVATSVSSLMGNWENFVNTQDDNVDPLIKCAISHYQFEAIHPFNDGNGRVGRMLMVFYLRQARLLVLPILFISGYLKNNQKEYNRLLGAVTEKGAWNDYILFMLKGFVRQAETSKAILLQILTLFYKFKSDIKKQHRNIYSADLVEHLFRYPVTAPVSMGKDLGIHYITASKYLRKLKKTGFLQDSKDGKYHFYFNHKLLALVRKGP